VTEFFIGFDPGLDGAYTVLDRGSNIVQVFDMPTVEVQVGKSMKRKVAPAAIADELKMFCGQSRAIVESVAARPGQGVSSMFGFGRSLGVLEGVLAGLGIPYELVPPQTWAKQMRIAPGKGGSRQRAMEVWPDKAGEFKRVKDDGRADSALIALYLMKHC
jgi:crossover junction endodeoxyribonuclease RuvC